MIKEGVGWVIPSPSKEIVSDGVLSWLKRVAEDRDKYRGYSRRLDQWGKGLTSFPTLRGLIGEYALCQFLNRRIGTRLSVDESKRPYGDGGFDISPYGCRIQVKTKQKSIGSLLIRSATETGCRIEQPWFAVVCATWPAACGLDGKLTNTETAFLDGWMLNKDATTRNQIPAYRGNHRNFEVPGREFCPMSDLVHLVELFKNW
jgi:hypothetical protein